MGYIRQNYHSGLTYQQECELCHTLVRYTDRILGFRPWFPDGFIYCPKCEKGVRTKVKIEDGKKTRVCAKCGAEL